MNSLIESVVNRVSVSKSSSVIRVLSDHTEVESAYYSVKEARLSEPLKEGLEDEQVTISADAVKKLNLEQQSKTSETPKGEEKQSDFLDKLIEETKDKIDQIKRSLEEVSGNSESAKQQRKALQTQLMLLNNQLVQLINKKVDSLEK